MNVVRTAWWYAIPPLVLSFPAFFVSPSAAVGCVLLGVAVLAFFRDPERSPPFEGVVSPADGKVSVIREERSRLRVGVFMNVTNVHVNRAPLPGTVDAVEHVSGSYRPAFSKDSDRNERVRIDVDGPEGEYSVILIAGAFARRITTYVEPGDELARGDRIGHIAFGSRADVLLPRSFQGTHVQVSRGEAVRAGETIIATEDRDEDRNGTILQSRTDRFSGTHGDPDSEISLGAGHGTRTDPDSETPPDASPGTRTDPDSETPEDKLQESEGS